MTPTETVPKRLPAGLKLALELGPLLLFFIAYSRPAPLQALFGPLFPAGALSGDSSGLFVATPVLMIAMVVALIVTYAMTRRIPVMPLITAMMVLVFGGLTLWLHDATFIKMKVTLVYCLFGVALLGGLAFGKPLLPIVLDSVLDLDETGWRTLTLRWGVFFFVLAALNEIVWRTQSEATWVAFKTFGTLPLTLIFAIAQMRLILRHEKKEAPEAAADHI